MPAVELTPNEKEFYRRECVHNEYNAADNWKKTYGDKLTQYDTLYKYIPGMQRCFSGLDTKEGLQFVSGFPAHSSQRPVKSEAKDVKVSAENLIKRPKSAKQKVGYGGLGVHSDFEERPRPIDTIYERDFCAARQRKPVESNVHGQSEKTFGTFNVIPTRWQFPPGVNPVPGLLIRSELRQLRLQKVADEQRQQRQSTEKSSSAELPKESTHSSIQQKSIKQLTGDTPSVKQSRHSSLPQTRRVFVRADRPWQSRSWAPIHNPAPKGWYQTDVGPGKIHMMPGRETVLNTPQARLNVLKRRMETRPVTASLQ